MSEEWDNLENYTWYPPEEVLSVRDARDDVIAVGIHINPTEPVDHGPVDVNEGPTVLAKPRHTNNAGKSCLACEWVTLKRKIEQAASDG